MNRWFAWVALSAAPFLAAACGGGDEDEDEFEPAGSVWTTPPGPPTPPANGAVLSGVFRDANVGGLDYDAPGLIATTGGDGRFQFANGSNIAFRIGPVTIGSGAGRMFMTPLNLVPSTATQAEANLQITNQIRFLQMLDDDADPENGVQISAAVRASAATWPAIDFLDQNFDASVAGVIAAASAADGVAKALPDGQAAGDHLRRSFRCTYNGLYRGTFSGSGSGVFAVAVYGAGNIWGFAQDNSERSGALFDSLNSMNLLSVVPTFTATGNGNFRVAGSFASPDQLLGTWSDTGESGSFVGVRSFGSDSAAVYRFVGYQFPLGTSVIVAFEIDANDIVTGQVIDLDERGNGQPVALSGSISGTALTANAASNAYRFTGTFDRSAAPQALSLSGTLQDTAKSRSISLSLGGCRLN